MYTPTPDNLEKIQYKDNAGNCFGFVSHEVTCPKDPKKKSENTQFKRRSARPLFTKFSFSLKTTNYI